MSESVRPAGIDHEFEQHILSGEEGYVALSRDTERDLAVRGKAGDRDALWTLCMANQNFVRSLAQRYLRQEVELEDLVAEGMVGLMEAAERFDPSRDVKFITYGAWWIKRAILRYLRNFDHPVHVPKYKQHELQEFRRTRSRLTQELGRTPSVSELCDAIGADEREIQEFVGLSTPAEVIDPAIDPGFDAEAWGDADVEAVAIRRDALLRLDAVMPVLTERERMVLQSRFGLDGSEPVTLSELGERVGLTKERIRQIEKLACSRLREALEQIPVEPARRRRSRRQAA